MGKKGSKSLRGKGENWEEPKKRFTLALTDVAIAGLDKLAKEVGLSRSELVERIGREIITVNFPEEPKQ